ncbi:hypothetical protein CUT44_11640 [Streptomyces carminius]|uniref:Uncharacterized protein n=1 Tax=Streptomyces carminius TaxID=2665496 RepID=A0A2M8LYK4_9ACTN|nr:hypothetical protein [Streptomyces carminius]PJE97057.1 hypothetical protein CUT44_14895 [Streptomyces carminius]PJE97766.1 hypothetical protein CUT44_11640 [Streptomyces carminius]
MPTDYACQAAAEQAAHGIAPIRALLVPAQRSGPPQQEEVSVVIRSFMGPQQTSRSSARREEGPPPVEPVGAPVGAAVLLSFLDGLRADLSGALVDWYSAIPTQLPQTLGVPGADSSGPPARIPNGWQSLADLQSNAQDVLTVLAGRPRGGQQVGPAELSWRLALLEDLFSGALRRMGIPDDTATDSAAELVGATGSLFGLNRPTPRSAPAPQQAY